MKAARSRLTTVAFLVAFILTVAASIATVRASPARGCCGSYDCGVINNNPYTSCNDLGRPELICLAGYSQFPMCCDLQGWCGN